VRKADALRFSRRRYAGCRGNHHSFSFDVGAAHNCIGWKAKAADATRKRSCTLRPPDVDVIPERFERKLNAKRLNLVFPGQNPDCLECASSDPLFRSAYLDGQARQASRAHTGMPSKMGRPG
jgi:hypothetical protein